MLRRVPGVNFEKECGKFAVNVVKQRGKYLMPIVDKKRVEKSEKV
jgi:hypothetical protein